MTFKEIETILRDALNEIKPAYVPDPEITFELGTDKERIIIEFNREMYDLREAK
ncbi:hypothetical protein [Peribacillus frigoritolerans]|uniref:hypothetical protein n=1 Tax=Peribacillus frigoritolerans TaxID=450367 RepID=UPI002E20551D|nr:hypothetical protein [Peribacillus frigoritolerans]MED3845544.1 hypothetical protein [Peribacillus frigoritolerans]